MESVGGHGTQEAELPVGPLVEEPARERLRETPEPAPGRVLLPPDVVRGEGEGRQVAQGPHLRRGRAVDGLLDDGRHDVRVEVKPGRALAGALREALREPEGRADEEGVHDSSLHQSVPERTRGWTPEACCSRTQSSRGGELMTNETEKPEAKAHMTIADVVARVDEIENASGDPESAHSLEDDLWRDVLQAIADGAPNAAGLAREALKTQDISFPRWCA